MVGGTVFQSVSYCGGAHPGEERLQEMTAPKALEGKTLYFKLGHINDESVPVSAQTSSKKDGTFSLELKPGTYCIVEEWKTKPLSIPEKTMFTDPDPACYKKLYSTCDLVLEINNKPVDGIIIDYRKQCTWEQPCLNYTGPMPP